MLDSLLLRAMRQPSSSSNRTCRVNGRSAVTRSERILYCNGQHFNDLPVTSLRGSTLAPFANSWSCIDSNEARGTAMSRRGVAPASKTIGLWVMSRYRKNHSASQGNNRDFLAVHHMFNSSTKTSQSEVRFRRRTNRFEPSADVNLRMGLAAEVARTGSICGIHVPSENRELRIVALDHKPVNGAGAAPAADFASEFLKRCHAVALAS